MTNKTNSVRKSSEDICYALMEAINSEPKTIDQLAKEIGSSWGTVWKYLELMDWIQRCPKLVRVKAGKRIEMWRREWGKLPK